MSTRTKVQALIPIAYLLITITLFALNLDNGQIKINQIAGIWLTLIAFTLWIIARFQLGEAFAIKPKAKFLVKTGFYKRLKHPIYYFSALAFLGIVLFFKSLPLLLVLIIGLSIQFLRTKKEEKILRKTYGEEYENYAKSTWL